MRTEDTSKRTEFSQTFVEDDGSRTVVVSEQRKFYLENGEMMPFDPQWTVAGNSIDLTGAHYDAMVSKNKLAYRFGKRELNKKIDIKIVSIDGNATPNLDFSNIVMQDNRVGFMNILPDLDVYWVAHHHGITLHKILRSDLAPREFVWDILKDKNIPANVGDRFRKGRDNIDKLVQRTIPPDVHRQLEIQSNIDARQDVGGRDHAIVTERWTGRVAAVAQGTRIKTWVNDVAYPVRMI